MKIEDKDIDKLLEDFQGADIKVPDNLDEKLNEFLYLNNESGCLFIIEPLLLSSIDLIPYLKL